MTQRKLSLAKNLMQIETIGRLKNKRLRQAALVDLSSRPEIFKALKELSYNCCQNNLKLSNKIRAKLRAKKTSLINLASKQTKNKKKAIAQIGGFLPILIPTLAAITTELITNLARNGA